MQLTILKMKKLLTPFLALFAAAASAAPGGGAVCFTFDDYHGENWLAADALFKKYNAHATFMISGEITDAKAAVMKQLQQRGHSIGLHTVHHRDATTFIQKYGEEWYFENEVAPQLDACKKHGIRVSSFAYPNNRRDERTDALMWKHFNYLRAGWGKAKKPLYFPANKIENKMVLGGGGIGTYYNTKVEDLKKLLDKAARTGSVIVFFSHNIAPGAERIHMPTEVLEELLKHAQSINLRVVGFDELTKLNSSVK